VATLVLIVAAQLAVPTRALFEDRPAPFGWQMYSARIGPLRVGVEAADDELRRVPPETVAVSWRPDVRYEQRLAPHVCAVVDDAREVALWREPPQPASEAGWIHPTVAIRHRCPGW
jgi:hypothetical protein